MKVHATLSTPTNVVTSDVGLSALRNVDVGHDGVGSPGQADDQTIGEKMNDNN